MTGEERDRVPPPPLQDDVPPEEDAPRVDLTQGRLASGILRLVWPIMLASLLQTLVGFADVVMVGRLPDATVGLAAVNMSWKIVFVVMVLVFAVTTGVQVLVSRAAGARDPRTAERATGQGFVLLVLTVGCVLSPLGYLFTPQLLQLTGGEPEVVDVGTPYLRLMFVAGPGMLTTYLFSACLQGAGDSRTPLILTACVNIINVALNWVFIFGNLGAPQMGVVGAAVGTVAARTLGATAALILLSSGRLAIKISWAEHLRPDFGMWWRTLRIGIPAGLQGFTRAISNWLALWLLTRAGDSTPVIGGAAIADQILMVTGFVGFAALPAGMTVVGQNMGAGRRDRAERGGWAVAKLAMLLMMIPALIYFVGASLWVPLVGKRATAEAVAFGVMALRILSLGEPAWAINMALGGALRGGGDTVAPLVFTIATQLCIGVGVGMLLVLGFGMGPHALWLSILGSMWVQSAVTALWFKRGRWKSLSV